MNQIKIGRYIAEKRKNQNLTQVQLAEKLGVSNKAVSKWERGVCLPDVSKYIELCNVLGITLNEFFAGEDLAEDKVVPQSEQNIISMAKSKKSTKRRMGGAILILVACVLAISGVLVWNAYEEGDFDNNCIYSYSVDAPEAADMLYSYGHTNLYTYILDEQYKTVTFKITKYEKGKIVDNEIMRRAELKIDLPKSKEDKEMIAILPDLDQKRFLISNTDYGSILTRVIGVDVEYDAFLEAIQVLDIGEEKIDVHRNEEIDLYAFLQFETLYLDFVPEFEEISANPEKALENVDVCYLISATFK